MTRLAGAALSDRPCGGQRRVVAAVTNPRTAEEMLGNMGLLHHCLRLAAIHRAADPRP